MVNQASSAELVPPTVLVVEDEDLVRMPIAEYLRDCGYRVLEAGNAGEAISLVDTADRVDVIFSDVRMPGEMDGFGLARWIGDHHPEVPILLTSGYAMSSGDDAYRMRVLEKPYSQARVCQEIRHLLNR